MNSDSCIRLGLKIDAAGRGSTEKPIFIIYTTNIGKLEVSGSSTFEHNFENHQSFTHVKQGTFFINSPMPDSYEK
jgi:hypothetical protein